MSTDNSTACSQRLLRQPEAADYLGLSASTLSKMRIRGDGPVFIKLGKVVAYDISDIDAWWKERRYKSTSAISKENGNCNELDLKNVEDKL